MKKGFTLLELIVVIIILGVLATLGFAQYSKMVEKGRSGEAKTNLGAIRTAQEAYYVEYGTYATTLANVQTTGLAGGLADAASGCNANYFFKYACTGGASGTATAARCGTGEGKSPGAGTTYTLSLTYPAGVLAGGPP